MSGEGKEEEDRGSPTADSRLIRLEDHPTRPAGWDDLPRDIDFTPWVAHELPPGSQSGTYFKSIRTTEDGREIWTWGGVDPETLAAGWTAGGGRIRA